MTDKNNSRGENRLGLLAKFNFIFWFTSAVTIFSGIASFWLTNDQNGFGQIADFLGGLMFGFLFSLIASIIFVIHLNRDLLDKLLVFSFILLIADILFLTILKFFD